MEWIRAFQQPAGLAASDATHFSFNGYKLDVPAHLSIEFFKQYANCLDAGNKLYFVERRTPIFRMHLDLDFLELVDAPEPDIKMYAKVFTTVFKSFYSKVNDEKQFICLVLKSKAKKQTLCAAGDEIEGALGKKHGYHLIWPWLCVDQISSLWLRENIILACRKEFGNRSAPNNSFIDVIDESVLKSNGLRMLFSDKCARCKDCKGKGAVSGQTCVKCAGSRYVAEGRRCELNCILDDNGEIDIVRTGVAKASTYDAVRLSSIRTSRKTPTPFFVIPASAVAPVGVEALQRATRKKKSSDEREFRDVTASNAMFSGSTDIERDTELFRMVEGCIQKLGVQWAEIELRKLSYKHSGGQACYLAKVGGTGSNWCYNVGRNHTSSTIYFYISADGFISQKCFSKKEGSGEIRCCKYSSQKTALSSLLKNVLFASTDATLQAREHATNVAGHEYSRAIGDLDEMNKKRKRELLDAYTEFDKQESILAAVKASAASRRAIQKALGKKSVVFKRADRPHSVFSDMTCAEVDKLSFLELMERDEQHVTKIKDTTLAVRSEAFKGKEPNGPEKKKKVYKKRKQ